MNRWGNWLMGLAFALAVVAAMTDGDGRSRWWPPLLATAFATAFIAQIADAYRTGIAVWRLTKWDRSRERIWFNLAVVALGAFAVLSLVLAIGF
jgi:hypothetical protein